MIFHPVSSSDVTTSDDVSTFRKKISSFSLYGTKSWCHSHLTRGGTAEEWSGGSNPSDVQSNGLG